MSNLDAKALEANFAAWRKERVPTLEESRAFERFAVDQVLKDADLTDEEIELGHMGGGDDGGVDSMYLFMNRTLILDETEPPDPVLTVEIVIIQAKNETGFKETAIQKLESFTNDLFDYSKPTEQLTYLNSLAKEAIDSIRDKYDKALKDAPSTKISYHYVTKSIESPNPKVQKRVENLENSVLSKLSTADIKVSFWGSPELLEAARRVPQKDEVIPTSEILSTEDSSVICLIKLNDFAEFLRDSHGNLKTRILEPNVRDYQGKRNPVNQEIRLTLDEKNTKEEFWWLNNGITILAATCSFSGRKLTIGNPEIVNGLQTCHEIHAAFSENPNPNETRKILVRVIIPKEDQSRNKIIKATNFQTQVQALSLRATDRIHFDIEDKLKLYNLYYDRRKGEYRRLRKPISEIISIRALAQACMAIILQRPDDARARPQSALKKDETYTEIFNDSYDSDVYATCILLDRQVGEFLEQSQHPKDVRRDIRYYMDMLLACKLLEVAKPKPEEIASLVKQCAVPFEPEELQGTCDKAFEAYTKFGATDKVAKGSELREYLIDSLKSMYLPFVCVLISSKIASYTLTLMLV